MYDSQKNGNRQYLKRYDKTVQVIMSPDSSAVFDPSVPTNGNADERCLAVSRRRRRPTVC